MIEHIDIIKLYISFQKIFGVAHMYETWVFSSRNVVVYWQFLALMLSVT
jgi:hypothetical protein